MRTSRMYGPRWTELAQRPSIPYSSPFLPRNLRATRRPSGKIFMSRHSRHHFKESGRAAHYIAGQGIRRLLRTAEIRVVLSGLMICNCCHNCEKRRNCCCGHRNSWPGSGPRVLSAASRQAHHHHRDLELWRSVDLAGRSAASMGSADPILRIRHPAPDRSV